MAWHRPTFGPDFTARFIRRRFFPYPLALPFWFRPAALVVALWGALPQQGQAQAKPEPPSDNLWTNPTGWSLHFQQTIIRQWHANLHSPYSGPNSLQDRESAKTSLTSTAFVGRRLWSGASVYCNPEVAGGSGLSGAFGIAGFPNGETFRIGDPAPVLYLARLYGRQIIALGAKADVPDSEQEDALNQVPDHLPDHYLSVTAGKFSIADFFDNNPYSHDPRTQFLNWALMSNGAWDYPANTRGYTIGAVLEYVAPAWAARLGTSAVPQVANGPVLAAYDGHNHSEVVELEGTVGSRHPLTLRALGYLTHARMGHYRDAVVRARLAGDAPSIATTRQVGNTKYGLGLNVSQPLTASLGWFGRASWNDGYNETWAFTEIDRSISAGLRWNPLGRPQDALGVALVANGLSQPHRDYLAAGGLGFIVGDGRLHYAPEAIGEVYYRYHIPGVLHATLTPDYQFILNPAYNRDRGPVHVVGIRAHVEL